MLDVRQFQDEVIRPVLGVLAGWNPAMNTPATTALLLGTALQESGLTFLRQRGGGPGLGLFQIEPASHDDVWNNFLATRRELSGIIESLAAGGRGDADQLTWNLGYGAAIARLIYWRAPAAMPPATDIDALGRYWKAHYNTPGGAGTAAEWSANYNRYVLGQT